MGLPKNVQPHYERANPEHKKTMLALRKTILEIVPQAEEVVSYGMPAFKVEENIVAGIMAAKNHVGYYPFSGSVLHLFSKELTSHTTTKSALHVPIGESLSKALISKLIKARIAQCPVKQGKVDLARYSKVDGFWRELGIAAPARRGLVDQKLLKLIDLMRVTEKEFLDIHAMGPKSAAIIKKEMKKEGIKFKVSKK
jgi:uncharacterized protein YdhG (YjbR/CyaY superfamily)